MSCHNINLNNKSYIYKQKTNYKSDFIMIDVIFYYKKYQL